MFYSKIIESPGLNNLKLIDPPEINNSKEIQDYPEEINSKLVESPVQSNTDIKTNTFVNVEMISNPLDTRTPIIHIK